MLRPSRSSLFVPGNRAAWIEKPAGYGADTLILDLEVSVPDQEKAAARPIVKAGITALAKKGQGVSVRVNGFATGLTLDDLEGVLCPELPSITLPKVETPADMHELDALLTRSEEHTSELQSRLHLVCRLLLEKKKKENKPPSSRRKSHIPETSGAQ